MEIPNPNYQGHYAGFGSRLIAYTIDLVAAVAGISVFWWLLKTSVEMLKVQEVLKALGWFEKLQLIFDSDNDFVLRGVFMILGVGLYHVTLLALANRTIGKAVMGLQVVPLNGGRIGFLRATVRYFGYIVSTVPLFFGFVWILFSRKRQGWHDKIARTCVVYTWEARPDQVVLQRGLNRVREVNEKRYGAVPEDAQKP